MFPLRRSLAALYALTMWTVGYGIDCDVRQIAIEEHCCDMCPPGKIYGRMMIMMITLHFKIIL